MEKFCIEAREEGGREKVRESEALARRAPAGLFPQEKSRKRTLDNQFIICKFVRDSDSDSPRALAHCFVRNPLCYFAPFMRDKFASVMARRGKKSSLFLSLSLSLSFFLFLSQGFMSVEEVKGAPVRSTNASVNY